MERDIETCQAERKNNKIKKEIMSLLNSFGLSGALEKCLGIVSCIPTWNAFL